MPLSSAEQQTIEDMVAAASPNQRDNMRLDAEAALKRTSHKHPLSNVKQRCVNVPFRYPGGGLGVSWLGQFMIDR